MAASPWAGRIKIIAGDATEFVFPGKYDLIISNPPFMKETLEVMNQKKNLAHHNEGLLLPELLNIIKKNLKPDGFFTCCYLTKEMKKLKSCLLKKNCLFSS
ncbi:MAG: methyltransferase [Chitinophagaceae bacterium]|nr:methyltransferase [Chitinophagaceae bacterium]